MFILKRYLKKVGAKLKGRHVPAPWVREQAIEGLVFANNILKGM